MAWDPPARPGFDGHDGHAGQAEGSWRAIIVPAGVAHNAAEVTCTRRHMPGILLNMFDRDEQLQALRPLCPDTDEEILRDFVSRMDSEYFERFTRTAIVRHIELASRLDPDHPCQMAISAGSDGLTDIVVIAYD